MTSDLYKLNRQNLVAKLNGATAVLTGYDLLQSSADTAMDFTQESSFLWLSGIEEPGWKIIVHGKNKRTILVRPKLSEQQLIFDGEIDDKKILLLSGADEIIQAKDFETVLRDIARSHSIVYTVHDKTDYGFVLNPAQKDLDRILQRIFKSVVSCQNEVNELKAIKNSYEIKCLQESIDVTARAFRQAKEELPNLKHEYELEAIFDYEFRRNNAVHAYAPIVASGVNACTLHYVKNNARLNKQGPVLIDIGARKSHYCADITRTLMVKPTKRQTEVHEVISAAQIEIIQLLEPGLPIVEYMKSSDAIICKGLMKLGLIHSLDDEKGYRTYMPHAISHGLGIDVHDSLGKPRYFKEGMVLTVEPGIYIKDEKIGMRIEDDILITASGHKNLSKKLSTNW